MSKEPFYNPELSYQDNYESGPFGAFADDEVVAMPEEMACEFLGQKIHTPFGIPAGPLLNAKYVKAALDKGFALPIYKTVRSGQHPCHQHPNILPVDLVGDLTPEKADVGLVSKADYNEPLSITNSFGVPSYKPDVWQSDVAEAVAYAKAGQMVGLSFQGTRWDEATSEDYVDDWVTTAKLAKETGAGFLEANLSCPNEGTTALLCFDVERVGEIARRLKEVIGDVPLLLKISYFSDSTLLENLVSEVGNVVQGFATINTISAEVKTPYGEQALPGAGRLRSGVCGDAIKWAGLEMTKHFAALRLKQNASFSIVGVGGVTKPADYLEYKEAGADVVMSATGAMWNPRLGEEVSKLSKS